jgi:hypothetical protein
MYQLVSGRVLTNEGQVPKLKKEPLTMNQRFKESLVV